VSEEQEFWGIRRPDGRVGVRDYLLAIRLWSAPNARRHELFEICRRVSPWRTLSVVLKLVSIGRLRSPR
jgi:altronate dehydratase